LQSQLAVS